MYIYIFVLIWWTTNLITKKKSSSIANDIIFSMSHTMKLLAGNILNIYLSFALGSCMLGFVLHFNKAASCELM